MIERDRNTPENAFETIAFRLRLKGSAEEYQRRHDALWPEMREALHRAGAIEFEIYWEPGSDRLFAWMRRRTDHSLADLPSLEIWRRWQEHMSDLLEMEGIGPARIELQNVFRLPPPPSD